MPKVSIIVPVYNVEKYLYECIDSILGQSLKDFELILINDGSSDKSGEICDEYAAKESRIRVIHKENGGPSSARNLGIKIAKGDYIGFVDSDDMIEKLMYKKMYEIAKEQNADMVTCGYKEVDPVVGTVKEMLTPLDGQLFLKSKMIRRKLETLLITNKILGYASMCNKLYRRAYLLNHNFVVNEEIKIAEDLCFNVTAMLNAERVCAINEALYIYRRINKSSLMNMKEGMFYIHIHARRNMLETFKKNNIDKHVYESCVGYESCKTFSEYIGFAKSKFATNESLRKRLRVIIQLFQEPEFIEAVHRVDNKNLVFKARIIIVIFKLIFSLQKLKLN